MSLFFIFMFKRFIYGVIMNKDAFKASWRFIRYDGYEIFDADAEYWERTAKEIADAGFTHVMTFSNTHFRWSFYKHWPLLTDVLRKLTAACHKYGLKVVEHHSANLLYTPAAIADEIQVDANRLKDLKYWPQMQADAEPGNTVDGVDLYSMFQVDGRTGKPQVTLYDAYIMCHNNEDYLRIYQDYLATLYAVGIDGIMTDDVQFLADGYAACACPSCRAKFFKEYGEELPPDGEAWENFIADETSDLFIKWKKFRYESVGNFHKTIKAGYEKLGYQMLRPNFAATCVSWRSPWGGWFDELPALDWAFIEHCCGVIRYSWPEFLVESLHCNMMARQRNIPAMSLYYPDRADVQELCWALSLYIGHRYFGDPRSEVLYQGQAEFHKFEEAHFNSLFKMRSNCRIALLDSALGRELDADYNTATRRVLCSLSQAMLRNNLPFTMTNAEHAAEFKDFAVIIVPGVAFLRDADLKALGEFANNGGKLVWLSGSGSWNTDTLQRRSESAIAALLNITVPENFKAVKVDDLSGGYIKRCAVKDADDREPYDCAEPTKWRPLNNDELTQYRKMTSFIASLLPGGADIKAEVPHKDLLISSFYAEDAPKMSIRLCNACGTQDAPELPGFGQQDPIPFPQFSGNIKLQIRKPDLWQNVRFTTAIGSTLQQTSFAVSIVDHGEYIMLECPLEHLHEFMLIEVE